MRSMVSTPGSGARSFRCKNAAARAERSPRIFTMCAISGARAGAGAGAAFGRGPGSPAAPASPRMALPAPRRAPTAPRTRRRRPPGKISRRPPEPAGAVRGRGRALPGPRHGCNGRGGALRGAGARREGPRPAAGRRRRRAASSGRRPVRRGSPRGGDHFPGLGRRAASKGRRATLQTALLRCAAGSSVSPTARHAARRIIEGAWIFCGVIVGVNPLRTVGTARVAMGLRFFRAECCGRVRTPGTDPRGEG